MILTLKRENAGNPKPIHEEKEFWRQYPLGREWQRETTPNVNTRWNVAKISPEKLVTAVQQERRAIEEFVGSKRDYSRVELSHRSCEALILPKHPMRKNWQPFHSWNDEAAQLKKECCRLRRGTQRAWKTHPEETLLLFTELKEAAKRLGTEINPLSLGHYLYIYYNRNKEVQRRKGNVFRRDSTFSEVKLRVVANPMKTKKVSGLDKIPDEVWKIELQGRAHRYGGICTTPISKIKNNSKKIC